MRYGLAYAGSKSQIAEEIVDYIPPWKRLVDLFGGGGAITHCALTYGKNKFKNVLYNDVDSLVVEYFENAIKGVYNADKNEPLIVDRETFFEEKDKDAMIANCWSFGNDCKSYIYGKEIERIKLLAFEMLTRNTVEKRYRAYRELIKEICSKENKFRTMADNSSLENISRVQSLERIQQYCGLDNISHNKLEITNKSYEDYSYQYGDIVYCDIPYENGTQVNRYSQNFDFKKFYDWAFDADFPVYFSSYEISDDRFKSELIKIKTSTLTVYNDKKVNEYIYMNQEAYKQQIETRLFL